MTFVLFPGILPLRPVGLTAVQGFIGLTVLFVIFQTTIDVRNKRTWIDDTINKGTGDTRNKTTDDKRKNESCGEPPSSLGTLVLYKHQNGSAFYVCPDRSVYNTVAWPCPIIYCQANGSFSKPDFPTDNTVCFSVAEKRTLFNESGEITSPNYPNNYVPASSNKTISWSIMTPGSNFTFRIEDFDVDSTSVLTIFCENLTRSFTNEHQATVIGQMVNCSTPCATVSFLVNSGPGGRGFKVSFQPTGDIINKTTDDKRKNESCGEPPSSLGTLLLYKHQNGSAFYDCPDPMVYNTFAWPCPIIHCQANGTFSKPDFPTNDSVCFPVADKRRLFNESGEFTSPNYPNNYVPASSSKTTSWSIMTPGSNFTFRIEDLDVDSTTVLTIFCEKLLKSFRKEDQATVIGNKVNCNTPCAIVSFLVRSDSGGKGFKISFRPQE
ncbi:hypothetical protein CHS0354_018749 [Potamilus streckersoni]|uniref:CUB domain-containing protein n=1 Tax=Potamilus streckersoni TaxID=2493646 RepID=A0AAE0T323_9BIVA|nr:hypothetical protein CHS0354_018749 [Potamilus streckersoni]